jgi:hypothetical protein
VVLSTPPGLPEGEVNNKKEEYFKVLSEGEDLGEVINE